MPMKFIPDPTDQSPGYQIHLLIMQFLKTVETTPGANPPGIARWYFLMGCLFWNSYSIMYPEFPFVDGFSAPRVKMNPKAPATECFQFFMQLIAVCYQQLAITELPTLPPIQLPANTHNYPYIQSQFLPAVASYLQARKNDGYYTKQSFDFPNKGHYIEVNSGTTQNLKEDLPSPNTWTPLSTHFPDGTIKKQQPLQPFFGQVRNWLSSDQLAAMHQIAEDNYPSEDLFKIQEQDMVDLQSQLTEDQKLKAEIWAGAPSPSSTPPSQWMIFLALILADNSYPLKESVALLGGVTFCLFHAGICAWGVKYKYMQPRPIQGIRRDYLDQPIFNTIIQQEVNGGDWVPYQNSKLYTPPFPDYVSGHSTFSMAVSMFFQMIFHSDTIPICAMIDASYFQIIAPPYKANNNPSTIANLYLVPHCSSIDPSLPTTMIELEWNTWSSLAREIGFSRISGGIHWLNSNMGGFAIGQWVAEQVIHQFDWNSFHLKL